MSGRLHLEGKLTRGGFSTELLLDLDLSEPVGVFGPTGAGKTTLLRIIAGLEPCFRGSVELTLDGHREIWSEPARGDVFPVYRRGVGVVFQDSRLLPSRTVQSNLDYAIRRARVAGPTQDVDSVTRALGIESLLSQQVESLSGGERQRVAIARALLSQPRLLLMDEPMAANDTGYRNVLIEYLAEWRKKHRTPLIYVSHSVAELQRLVHQCVVMERGQIVAHGKTAEVTSGSEEGAVANAGEPRVVATVLSADAATGSLIVQVDAEDADSLSSIDVGDQLTFKPN